MLYLGCLAQPRYVAGGDEADRQAAGIIDLSQILDRVNLRIFLIGIAGLGMGHVVVVIELGRVDIISSPGTHCEGGRTSDHGQFEGDLNGLGIIG